MIDELIRQAIYDAVRDALSGLPLQHEQRISYTIAEAAAATGCSEWDIRTAIKRGDLHAKQAGERGKYVIHRDHLSSWIKGTPIRKSA